MRNTTRNCMPARRWYCARSMSNLTSNYASAKRGSYSVMKLLSTSISICSSALPMPSPPLHSLQISYSRTDCKATWSSMRIQRHQFPTSKIVPWRVLTSENPAWSVWPVLLNFPTLIYDKTTVWSARTSWSTTLLPTGAKRLIWLRSPLLSTE